LRGAGDHQVVGPADVDLMLHGEAEGGGDCRLDSDGGAEGEALRDVEGDGWGDERGHVEAVCCCGMPVMRAAASARGLLVGDPDAMARPGVGDGERERVRGGNGGEVLHPAGKFCSGNGGIDGRHIKARNGRRGHLPPEGNTSRMGTDSTVVEGGPKTTGTTE